MAKCDDNSDGFRDDGMAVVKHPSASSMEFMTTVTTRTAANDVKVVGKMERVKSTAPTAAINGGGDEVSSSFNSRSTTRRWRWRWRSRKEETLWQRTMTPAKVLEVAADG